MNATTLDILVLALVFVLLFGISLHTKVKVPQPCPTFCDPMDHSLPGSSVHGILQFRTLEWIAILFSRRFILTHGSNPGLLHCRQILYGLNH